MKRRLSVRSLANSIIGLIVPPKGINPHKLSPKKYLKKYWFDEKDSDGIYLVHKIFRITRKEAADMIFQLGFSSIISEFVGAHVAQSIEEHDAQQDPKVTRVNAEFFRFCQKQGVDVGEFS